MPRFDPSRDAARATGRFAEIVAHTDAIAATHLDAEYAALCRRMTDVLARRRPSPLDRGQARTWAAAIVHAVGWVNFLTDPSQRPHMTTAALAAASGVAQSSIAALLRTIRDALALTQFDPEWTLPGKLLDNPLAWIVLVDGVPLDLRDAPREVQRAAFREGLIPFVPGPVEDGRELSGKREPEPENEPEHEPENEPGPAAFRPDDTGIREAMAEAQRVLHEAMAEHPDATIDELNAVLQRATAGYNRHAQAELGGLSPVAVDELLVADWERAGSAIRIDGSLPLATLDGARALHNARLVLGMLATHGTVKATPKGNLPRTFVTEFHGRMHRSEGEQEEASFMEPRVRNEEDLFPLHVMRLLLEIAGLVKRRRGVFSLTQRGARLAGDERAGELLAILVRTQFRRLNLAYLDRAAPGPEFQRTIGYTLYQFGRTGDQWRSADALTADVVLPAVRRAIPANPYYDALALVLETRFLRPLAAFGLVEERSLPREPGAFISRREYRKSPLFDRAVSFRVAADAGGSESAGAHRSR